MGLTGKDFVDQAREWIGTPYLHQGSVKGVGCDCLGLLRGVWRANLGHEPERVPAYTRDWSEATGDEHLWQAANRWLAPAGPEVAEGDVLLFRMRSGSVAKHLGIAAAVQGGLSFIHAYDGHGVVESPLTDPWARRIVARFSFPISG